MKPEVNHHRTWYQNQSDELTIEASAFYRLAMIFDWVKTPEAEKWESRNLTNVNAMGFEFSGEYRFKIRFYNP